MLIKPKQPIKVAIIGAGERSRTIYQPLWDSLKPWVEVVAVCDPIRAHADAMAERLGVKAFYNIHELVRSKPMEAAVVLTPLESHHSISVFLSTHQVHNLIETPWCSMVIQADEMINAARRNGVITRVAENFFRFPVDRFAQTVKVSGQIGEIKRIFSYNDHTGYHNNSRWIVFANSHPLWVQSIDHGMAVAPFHSSKERFHDYETFIARYFMFPDELLVIDQAANNKGFLGRHPRPGYTEWQGGKGTLVHRANFPTTSPSIEYQNDGTIIHRDGHTWTAETELRICSDRNRGEPNFGGGHADQISKVMYEFDNRRWMRTFANTANGNKIEYVNTLHPMHLSEHMHDEYGTCVMGHVVDFALAISGTAPSEFNDEDALMSLMMEIGARESALHEGTRIALPLSGELEADLMIRNSIKQKLGVDPLDVEAMLNISYPKP